MNNLNALYNSLKSMIDDRIYELLDKKGERDVDDECLQIKCDINIFPPSSMDYENVEWVYKDSDDNVFVIYSDGDECNLEYFSTDSKMQLINGLEII